MPSAPSPPEQKKERLRSASAKAWIQTQPSCLEKSRLTNFFLLLSKCANTKQLGRQVLSKSIFFFFPLGLIFPAARFEPWTAGYEERMLPLSYAIPLRQTNLIINDFRLAQRAYSGQRL